MTHMKTCHHYLGKKSISYLYSQNEPLCCNLFFNNFKMIRFNLDFKKENIFVICVKTLRAKNRCCNRPLLTDQISWHFCHAMIYHFVLKPQVGFDNITYTNLNKHKKIFNSTNYNQPCEFYQIKYLSNTLLRLFKNNYPTIISLVQF